MGKRAYSGTERRKYLRKKERLKIEYAPQDELERKKLSKIRLAYSYDISGGGLSIYVKGDEDIGFKEGGELYLVINLPEQKKMILLMEVVQIRHITFLEGKEYKYRIGLRFMDIKEDDRAVLMNFIGSPQASSGFFGKREKNYDRT